MKIIRVVLLCAVCLFLLAPLAFGAENNDFGKDDVVESVPDDAQSLFSLLGIEEYSFEELLAVSPGRVFEVIIGIFTDRMTQPLRMFVVALGILLTITVFSSVITDGHSREFIENIGCAAAASAVLVSVLSCAADCFASVETTKGFMLSLIPILAGIVTFAGNPALALSFNTGVLAFAEGISVLIDNVLTVLVSVYASLCVSGVLNPVFKPAGIAALVKKITVFVLGLVSGVFVAVLSIKGVIAGAADTVAVRGVRFMLGNTVPVVGSAIGEALNSLIAGFSLTKNTIGMIGIIAVAFVNLPVLIELILRSLALSVLAVCSEVLGHEKATEFFTALRGLFSMLSAVLIFNAFVYVISIFIVITVKNSA